MLTKDLLEVNKHKPNIHPRFREIEQYRELARDVIGIYEEAAAAGETRAEIDEAVAARETHETFKLVRALSTLLERRSTFEQRAPFPPADLRAAAFERGFVVNADERDRVLAAVAADVGLDPAEVDAALWADRADREVLVDPPDIAPEALLRQYNLSLAQTLLFDAVSLTFTASDGYQAIFGRLKYLGLMYLVDEALSVTVTGPGALFSHTRKYGTSLAKLLPTIMTAAEWTIAAQIETEVGDERRIYEFHLDADDDHLFPERTTTETFDSEVERDFAARIDALADGWSVRREPTILRTGTRVMIPDFSFVRERGDGTPACYLEVIGFWTPEYLEKKVAKVRALESDVPIVLAVDEDLNCTEETFADAPVDEVFFYDGSIPVKPVLARLQAIDEREIQRELDALTAAEIDVPSAAVTPIEALAAAHECEPAAMGRYLDDHAPGTVSNDRYVPPAVLDTIRDGVAALDEPTLADVSPLIESHGVAPTILEELGYTIEFSTLNRADALVRRVE